MPPPLYWNVPGTIIPSQNYIRKDRNPTLVILNPNCYAKNSEKSKCYRDLMKELIIHSIDYEKLKQRGKIITVDKPKGTITVQTKTGSVNMVVCDKAFTWDWIDRRHTKWDGGPRP